MLAINPWPTIIGVWSAPASGLAGDWAQDSLWQPEDDGCGDADGGHEGVGAAVIAGMDAAPVLEFAKHILDLVTLPIKDRVVRDGHCAVGL